MSQRDLVVMGASSGGIDALRTLLGSLPSETRASLFVVLHTAPSSPGFLSGMLSRASTLPVAYAVDRAPIRAGSVTVAPADLHLLVEPNGVRLSKGPRENRSRPSIDVLFRSAARAFGPRVVGVVLTGELSDGAVGLWTIKRLGGVTIVQDPAEASSPSMPRRALGYGEPDYCVRVAQMGPLIARLAETPVDEPRVRLDPESQAVIDAEVRIAKGENPLSTDLLNIAPPSAFACPDCHGVMREIPDGSHAHFRCHTGHAHSLESLIESLLNTVDALTWSTVRACNETVMALESLTHRPSAGAAHPDAARLASLARRYRDRAEHLRRSLSEIGTETKVSVT